MPITNFYDGQVVTGAQLNTTFGTCASLPPGTSVLAADGTGNFRVVTIGTGLSYAGGTLSTTAIQGGTTAQRPTLASTPPVKQFQLYFDTTLDQPVFVSQISPSIVWVNAAGVVV